jgi:hypothetical protein
MKLLQDEEGSVIPLIAVVIIIFIFLGAYEIGNLLVYRDRAVVRDAIDSAVTSALAAGTTVESASTKYTEEHIVETGTDADGNDVVIADYWEPHESSPKNYIYLDRSKAETTATNNFAKIISGNNVKASLTKWKFTVTYDDDRYLSVTQNRSHTDIAPSWWQDFGDSVPTLWNKPTSNEQKYVRFPRWVKVSITATVNVPVHMGGIFGKTTQSFTWGTEGIKELTPDKISN